MSEETNKYNIKCPINSDFSTKILIQLEDNKLSPSQARYILLKWFDWMNSDPEIQYETKDEFILSAKREYDEMMVNKVKEAILLVELLDERDKEKRDNLVRLLEELR